MNYNDSVISNVKFVSLAYTLGKGLDEQFGKLFMYKNNRGPIIIPWGITQWRKQDLESGPLKEHICVYFSKYELNQLDRTEGERVHFPNNG